MSDARHTRAAAQAGDTVHKAEVLEAQGSSEGSFLLSTVNSMVNWCRKNSV